MKTIIVRLALAIAALGGLAGAGFLVAAGSLIGLFMLGTGGLMALFWIIFSLSCAWFGVELMCWVIERPSRSQPRPRLFTMTNVRREN